jgi:outer membrane protein assembly factor BamB
MAIRTQGIVTVDDSRNFFLNNLTFSDSSSVSSLGLVPGSLKWVLDNPNAYSTSVDDSFGLSVSISGNYAIVGANLEDDSGGTTSGKAYIFNVTTGALVHTLNNPNAYGTSASDRFGESVSISGNYAIVGAYLEDDSGGTGSGKAYIFNVTTGALVHTLNNPNAYSTSTDDSFGFSVSISGNYAIVGADVESDAGGLASGKAYIFNVTTGSLVYTLNNPNAYSTSAVDIFGVTIDISGNYAIVGAYNEDDSGGTTSGKAYIFNVTTGALVHTLNNPNAYGTSASDAFGYSVSISGNYAIVGAYQEDDSVGGASGKSYIFSVSDVYTLTNVEELQVANGLKISADNKLLQQSVPGGALIHKLDNPNAYGTSASDNFGYSVSISGNYAIVGAYLEDDSGGTGSGKAYIFNVTTGALVHTLNNPNAYSTSTNDIFGWSVSISGNYAIVGADDEDDSGGTTSGKAYIFNVTTGALVHTLNNPNAYSTSAGDFFGRPVYISGNYAIVGAYNEDDSGGTQSGKAYIFNVTTGALLWTLNNPNAYDTSGSDQFGYSVSISGNYAIVGANLEDDSGGTGSGKAYIFNVTTGALVHTLNNPNAYSTSGSDQFGYSVSISGNYAIVCAYIEDDTGGSSSGKAYIFNVTTGALVWTLDNPNAYSTSDGDGFGVSVSISGNYAIVGAYAEDDSGGTFSGKSYIFSVRDLTYLDRLVQMVS